MTESETTEYKKILKIFSIIVSIVIIIISIVTSSIHMYFENKSQKEYNEFYSSKKENYSSKVSSHTDNKYNSTTSSKEDDIISQESVIQNNNNVPTKNGFYKKDDGSYVAVYADDDAYYVEISIVRLTNISGKAYENDKGIFVTGISSADENSRINVQLKYNTDMSTVVMEVINSNWDLLPVGTIEIFNKDEDFTTGP